MKTEIRIILLSVIAAGLAHAGCSGEKTPEEKLREDPRRYIEENKKAFIEKYRSDVAPWIDSVRFYYDLCMEGMLRSLPPEEIRKRYRERLLHWKQLISRRTERFQKEFPEAGVRLEEAIQPFRDLDSIMRTFEPVYQRLMRYGVDLKEDTIVLDTTYIE